MATTETPKKLRLQSVGWVPAVEASELKVGDQLMYNFGSVCQIVKIEEASPKFLRVHEVSTERGTEYQRRVKKTSMVARVPEKDRRRVGVEAPATDYRAQVKAPTGDLGWVTVSHGATVDDATSGHPAYFGSSLLGKYLGGGYDAIKASIQAMADGETITAESGHSFRILSPEQPQAPAPAAVEGAVIPAGHTLGIPARLADDVNARDAYAVLVAAGHTPAELSPEGDDDYYGDDPAQGTGFRIDVRDGGRVLVYHIVKGVDSWHALSDSERRLHLRLYRRALREAGWETDPYLTRCVHAWRTSPLPEGVTLAQTRGEEPTEEAGPIPAEDFTPEQVEEARGIARGVFAEVAAESEKEQAALRTLPTLEGHTITASLQGSMWTVSLYADGSAVPLYVDKIGDHVNDGPAYAARELIRVCTAALEEVAALLALDDETLYEVCEYRASTPTADPVTMTGRDARAHLAAARAEAGPEQPHGRNTPRFTLEHSGAHWWATTHAYKGGHRDQWNRRHIAVRPLVVAKAAHLIMEFTGDGCISPVERPSLEAYGPWVRPVEGRADMVTVNRVSGGLTARPQHEPAATRWDEWTQAYREALEGAGWHLVNPCADWADGGAVFLAPGNNA